VKLLDTNVAILLREQGSTFEHMHRLVGEPALSIFSWIELEGGVHAQPAVADLRRRRLDAMLSAIAILPFDPRVITIYGEMVAALGFSRRQIFDRLIAATAIVHDLVLVTMNEADFRDIPDLRLEVWPAQ